MGVLKNELLVCAVLSWLLAQVIKTILDIHFCGEFKPERLVGSGGMPSSHSATVCGLAMGSLLTYGVESFEFAVCFVLAAVVMYDATGVRRETGKQARVLNWMMSLEIFDVNLDESKRQEQLKELVGHTPLQVLAGAVLGCLVACIFHRAIA